MAIFRPGVLEIQKQGDPLLQFQWMVVFPNIPGSNTSRDYTYRAVSTTVPGTEIEQANLEVHGLKLNYAGRRMWTGSWDVTMFESRLNNSRDSLIQWMNATRDWDTNSGLYKPEYAVPVELMLLDAKNEVVRTFILEGVWPKNVQDVTLDQSSTVVQLQCSFSYDRTREFNGALV